MAHLTRPQRAVLALYSFGIVLAQTCGMSKVVASLATNLGQNERNLRQRLREWCWEGAQKRGKARRDWQVSLSFGPLLAWVVSLWPSQEQRIVLAMDATSLKQTFVALSISVVYRGCSIPVAWKILPEGKPGAWKPHWLDLFQSLRGIIPSDWQVLVMADRGLYGHWLYHLIQSLGWHPFLRLNNDFVYRRRGGHIFRSMKSLLPKPGHAWAGRVTCFRGHPIQATLLASWGQGYRDPWLIITDLPHTQASVHWYSWRSWIECGFQDFKRGGWQWQRTRMIHPERAGRLWLALAVATLWVLSVGGEADASRPDPVLEDLPLNHIARRTKRHGRPRRLLSCFTQGIMELQKMIMGSFSIFLSQFYPEPLPQKTYP